MLMSPSFMLRKAALLDGRPKIGRQGTVTVRMRPSAVGGVPWSAT